MFETASKALALAGVGFLFLLVLLDEDRPGPGDTIVLEAMSWECIATDRPDSFEDGPPHRCIRYQMIDAGPGFPY